VNFNDFAAVVCLPHPARGQSGMTRFDGGEFTSQPSRRRGNSEQSARQPGRIVCGPDAPLAKFPKVKPS